MDSDDPVCLAASASFTNPRPVLTFIERGGTRGQRHHPHQLVLVEDDQDSLEAFSIILGEKSRRLRYARVEALEAIEAAKRMCVLDIGMKPVGGVQCLKGDPSHAGYGIFPPWR